MKKKKLHSLVNNGFKKETREELHNLKDDLILCRKHIYCQNGGTKRNFCDGGIK